MATATDLTAKAQAAAEQLATRLADRMPELPKPVLAAIGAADLAGRQLMELLEKLGERTGFADLPRSPGAVGDRVSGSLSGAVGDARGAAEDLPAKVSGMVSELPSRAKEFADQLEGLATRIPGKVQKFTDELPDKVAEVGEQLQPDHLRQTAEAYGQLAGNIFSSLVERGEKAWSEVRSGGPVPGTVIEGEKLDPVKVSQERAAAARAAAEEAPFPKSEPPTPQAAASAPKTPRSGAAKVAPVKPAPKAAPAKPVAAKPVAAKPVAKPAAAKPAAAKPAAVKPVAKKPAATRKPATPKGPLAEPVDPATLPAHVVPKSAGTPRPARRRPTPPAGS